MNMNNTFPLVLDLDGTYVYSDMTYELLISYLKHNLLIGWFNIFIWVIQGKALLKRKLVEHAADHIAIDNVPRTHTGIDALCANYTEILLVSGSDQRVVDQFVKRDKRIISGYGSTGEKNLIGANKRDFLIAQYPNGFDYVGNSKADIPIWKAAKSAFGINLAPSTFNLAKKSGVEFESFQYRPSIWSLIIKEMRLSQWSKNLLIFIPALLAVKSIDLSSLVALFFAFTAAGLTASSTYILNDLFDIEVDRKHPKKCTRPIASGQLPVIIAIIAMSFLFISGMVIASIVSYEAFVYLAMYTVISVSYTFVLKQIAVLDVMVLSALFCLRTVYGASVISVYPNFWFLLAIYFFFMSLALGKRVIELTRITNEDALLGRGYKRDDRPILMHFGVVTGVVSLVIVTLYLLLSKSVIIQNEMAAAMIILPLLFWLLRFWLLINQKKVDYDPVKFAMTDKVSVMCFSLIGLVLLTEQALL